MKKKIMILTSGFEWTWGWRIASIMENYFYDKYQTVTLVSFYDKWIFPIKWKKINIWTFWKKEFPGRAYIALPIHIFNTIRYIKKEKPDIVIWIWTYNNFLWLVAKRFIKFKLLLTQHEHITTKIKSDATFTDKVLFKLNKKLIWNTNIVCVSKEVKNDTIKYYNISKKQASTIYNWLNFELIKTLWNKPIDIRDKYIINIGSLDDRKNQEMLIKAYAKTECKNKYKLLLLWVWPKKDFLMNLAKDLGIEKNVIFAWFNKNPYKFLKNASMFCFTSLSEALPTVLIESLILEVLVLTVPVIWSEEILDNWNYWIITKDWDIDEYVKLMDEYINKDDSEMTKLWYKFAKDNFEINVMMEKYETLLENL